jgi:hypothetical protein
MQVDLSGTPDNRRNRRPGQSVRQDDRNAVAGEDRMCVALPDRAQLSLDVVSVGRKPLRLCVEYSLLR